MIYRSLTSYRIALVLLAFLTIMPVVAIAQRPAQLLKWKQRRSALDRKHAVDEFRIYYTLSGDDALPDATCR